MQKIAVSLNRNLISKLLILGFCLVIGMVAISSYQYTYGINSVIEIAGRLEARTAARQLEQLPLTETSAISTSQVYRSWQQLPASIRNAAAKTSDAVPPEQYTEGFYAESQQLWYFSVLPHSLNSGKTLYLLNRYPAEEIELLITEYISLVINQSLIAIAVFLVLLFALSSLWLRQLSQPFVELNRWAEKLGTAEATPREQYRYSELNQLASLFENAVDRLGAYNERERLFLRHASHELRTPLAILQASLDTLDLRYPEARPLERARYACDSMQLTSTTLLWLARESTDPLTKSDIDLKALCDGVVEDLAYLGTSKDLTVSVDGRGRIKQHQPLVQLVVANLIRNAFQYSAPGKIQLLITANSVLVHNPTEFSDSPPVGFGLGLELVHRICSRQQWTFDYQDEGSSVLATVSFQTVKSQSEST
ncbi:HAMP domain-containing sensor histidine kinase [Motiliproteus sp. MSK22-1]|uniref:sensor histidine kinase n=1 Tax=Motiliproteus sp. MSK22-1 TaxID=1897630 RepID=UPI00117C4CB9|nr:HAMP domain-containing sensor histidine kinase [Motiliproteus sp. MSK22-1]